MAGQKGTIIFARGDHVVEGPVPVRSTGISFQLPLAVQAKPIARRPQNGGVDTQEGNTSEILSFLLLKVTNVRIMTLWATFLYLWRFFWRRTACLCGIAACFI